MIEWVYGLPLAWLIVVVFAGIWRFSIGARAFSHSLRLIESSAHICASSSSLACFCSISACHSAPSLPSTVPIREAGRSGESSR